MSNIFEQPWILLIIAILVTIAMLVFRSMFTEKRFWWQWLIPIILVAAAFGLDRLVETDLEKIKAVIYTSSKAVEQENPDAIEPIVSADYRDSLHSNKANLMRHCRARLSDPLVEKNVTRIASIDIQNPTATALFTVRMVFDKQSFIYNNFKSTIFTKVKIELRKELDDKWLISRLEILEIDRQQVNWKDIRNTNW